jgi:hypothetical protein
MTDSASHLPPLQQRTIKVFCVLHSDDVREKMKVRYLSNPDYNFEKVNRASMACGPMVKWAIAQVIECDITVSFIFSKVAACI